MVSLRPWPRWPQYPFHIRKGVPQSNSGRFEEQKYFLLLPAFEPRTLQPFACSLSIYFCICDLFNRLTPNDPYMGRTAPLTSKRCILYIYSTNIDAEYFKHALYSPFFALQNAVCFIMLTCLVPVLFTFYIQDVLKLKKIIIQAPKG